MSSTVSRCHTVVVSGWLGLGLGLGLGLVWGLRLGLVMFFFVENWRNSWRNSVVLNFVLLIVEVQGIHDLFFFWGGNKN